MITSKPLLGAFLLVLLSLGCVNPSLPPAPATPTVASLALEPTPTPLTSTMAVVPNRSGVDLLSVPELVKRLRPAVVHIQTEALRLDMFSRPIPEVGVGTGIVLDRDGNIATNEHVVQGARRILVTMADGRSFQATLVGGDRLTDLAVVRIQADGLQAATLGASDRLEVGEEVVAIGHALNLPGGPTVTKGVVSAVGRIIQEAGFPITEGLIQTDTAINPGNSGGPLVNLKGEVIGINTARLSAEGIGFSIAIDSAKPIVAELIQKGRVERGFLGIGQVDITPALAQNFSLPTDKGIGINSVSPDGPAARAGLRSGDIIISIGSMSINNSFDLIKALTTFRPGQSVKVDFFRDSIKMSKEVVLGERPR